MTTADPFKIKTPEERLVEIGQLYVLLSEDPITPAATLRLVKLLTIDLMERLAEET